MGLLDFILFPFYLLLFHLIFKAIRKSYKDPLLQKYHRNGFWVKVFCTLAFSVFSVYLSPGDSLGLYNNEGVNIYHLILHDKTNLKWLWLPGSSFDESLLLDPWNAGYFRGDSNYLVTRIVTVLSFFTMGKYLITSLIFSLIAFTGAWKLFLFFYEQYPTLHKKFALAILYLPSFVFWTGGILKDPLCIAALGWITYSLYEIFYRNKNVIKNLLITFIAGYLLAIIKVYILVSYVPFFSLFILLKKMSLINNKALKYFVFPTLILCSLFAFNRVLDSFSDELGQYAVKDITKSVQVANKNFQTLDAESNFSLGAEVDGSLKGLVKLMPIATGTTLFRPFLWESRKPSTLMASMESLILMFFTAFLIWKAGPRLFLRSIFKDPLIMFCFLFSIVFALFIGATTLNFGTLVRYKIPCLPFYIISLYLIYEKVKEKQRVKAALESEPVFLQPELYAGNLI